MGFRKSQNGRLRDIFSHIYRTVAAHALWHDVVEVTASVVYKRPAVVYGESGGSKRVDVLAVVFNAAVNYDRILTVVQTSTFGNNEKIPFTHFEIAFQISAVVRHLVIIVIVKRVDESFVGVHARLRSADEKFDGHTPFEHLAVLSESHRQIVCARVQQIVYLGDALLVYDVVFVGNAACNSDISFLFASVINERLQICDLNVRLLYLLFDRHDTSRERVAFLVQIHVADVYDSLCRRYASRREHKQVAIVFKGAVICQLMIHIHRAESGHSAVVDKLFGFVSIAARIKGPLLVKRYLARVGHISGIRFSVAERYRAVVFDRSPVHNMF